MHRVIVAIVLVAFGGLTALALQRHGYLGVFASSFESFAGMQVLADLTIALMMVMVWLYHDAKAAGRRFWPWFVATLLLGSFSPLVYLLTRKPRQVAGQSERGATGSVPLGEEAGAPRVTR